MRKFGNNSHNSHTVFIGIGSNLDNPRSQCKRAVEFMGGIAHSRITAMSSLYLSDPLVPSGMEAKDFPKYINAVCRLETMLKPPDLLEKLKGIEKNMGRTHRAKWAPRVIDLDILLYDDIVVKTENLTIPHPEIHNRCFVLEPLAELDPNIIHPVLDKSVTKLLGELKSALKVKKITEGESHAVFY